MGNRAGDTRSEVCRLNLVTVTEVSQTLEALVAAAGFVINNRARVFKFMNTDANDIRVNVGEAAVVTSYRLIPTAQVACRVTPQTAATIQFISIGGNSDMNVEQLGDE